MAWRIEVVAGARTWRAAAGEWLYEVRGELSDPIDLDWPQWGPGKVDRDLATTAPELAGVDWWQFDYDLLQGSVDRFGGMLSRLLPPQVSGAIVAASRTPPRRIYDGYAELPPIEPDGNPPIPWIDLPVASTTSANNYSGGVRNVFAFVGENWLVTARGPFITSADFHDGPPCMWSEDLRLGRTLPADRARLGPGEASTGQDLLLHLASTFLSHHDGSVLGIMDGLVLWEAEFLDQRGSLDAITAQTDRLARIGRALACQSWGVRALQARFGRQPVFGTADAELLERSESTLARVGTARNDVRECFALSGQALDGIQAEIASDRARELRRFELGAGIITAFVLVPGLVIGFYGANVEGLPGQGDASGLAFMLVGAILSGLGTILLLMAVSRRKPR